MTNRCLLVVDADLALLTTVGRMLGSSCAVVTARTVEAALDVLADADHLDAVIVSAELCVKGVDLMQWASLAHPRARRLTTSGGSANRLCEVLDGARALGILEQPVALVHPRAGEPAEVSPAPPAAGG